MGKEVSGKEYDFDEDEYDDFEISAYLSGCTCDHMADDHGWGSHACKVEGCNCSGGWEE